MVAPSPAVLPASSALVAVASTTLFAPVTPKDIIAKKVRKPRFLKAAEMTTPELTLQMQNLILGLGGESSVLLEREG